MSRAQRDVQMGLCLWQGPDPAATQAVPEYVTAIATLLGLIYPDQGMEESLRTDHVDRMTFQDHAKVMDVSAAPIHYIP